MRRFTILAGFGAFLSLSISLGLIALFVAIIVALLPAIAWRSALALAAVLVGWGATWLVLIGNTYVGCVSRAPDCGGSERILPFVLVGAGILTAGLLIGWRVQRSHSMQHSA